jgi:uncharacterized protein (DUF2267 family)
MNTNELEAFVKAEHTAQVWLRAVADRLLTPDLHYSYRLLRAWLHTVRDRLPIGQAVHLAAQLPELLRGVYYEGWEPVKAPVKLDAEAFVARFAREARISTAEVRHGAPAVSMALHGMFSPGQLQHTFAQLPHHVRAIVEPVGGLPPAPPIETHCQVVRALPMQRTWSPGPDRRRALDL